MDTSVQHCTANRNVQHCTEGIVQMPPEHWQAWSINSSLRNLSHWMKAEILECQQRKR